MRSLRTRITLMTVCVAIVAVNIIALLSVVFIRRTERRKSDQLLLLLCETGERNLNYYFNSVQKSVGKVAAFAEADLTELSDEELREHTRRVEEYFDETASRTNGVLTYYYRIDPEISDTVKGFWYTNLDGEGFTEHEVTDITLYDTEDTSALVWFTVPKYTGSAIWLPPYITDNLNMRVISYNVPIYWRGQFIGVVGIEIDYSTMAEQVDSIRLYGNGYAYLCDADGNLFYHPRLDLSQLTEETKPAVPEGAVGESTFIRYRFEGVERQAAWLPLSNGMRLTVTVPVYETEGDWQKLMWDILILAVAVIIAASLFTMYYTRRITKPLEELTRAAEQMDQGNYSYQLSYNRDDEVGRLTNTFQRLAGHMRDHISDLNKQVYIDALTNVKNKGAFTTIMEEMQARMNEGGAVMEFAIGVFDCDDLKQVNDQYGHDKGDVYLRTASRAICRVFQHSPVFRIGGDEFSVILQNEDYQNREALIAQLEEIGTGSSDTATDRWSQVHLSMGFAVYDPRRDHTMIEVVRRADRTMYENKREHKTGRQS